MINTKQLVMETWCVYCEVGTHFYATSINFSALAAPWLGRPVRRLLVAKVLVQYRGQSMWELWWTK